jgi:hypothetical protein
LRRRWCKSVIDSTNHCTYNLTRNGTVSQLFRRNYFYLPFLDLWVVHFPTRSQHRLCRTWSTTEFSSPAILHSLFPGPTRPPGLGSHAQLKAATA